MDRIPVAGPWITPKEVAYVTDAAQNAWYGNAGMYHERFEAAMGKVCRRAHAVALPSCTSAIHLALCAAGIGPGDEVVVPETTWIASAAPVHYVGAKPVFGDIDPVSWCLCPRSLERCLTPRTRAVIPVDLYGNLPDWDAILEIARARGLVVIEDAAQAIGASYKGRPAGSFGAMSVFSFHGSKAVTTGEGGMLLTDDPALFQRVLFLRDHGRKPGDDLFYNAEVAFKYRMSAMQAALGLAQVERLPELIERKREIFAWYERRLGGLEGVTLNREKEEVRSIFWMVTAILDPSLGFTKDRLAERMRESGVDTRPFFFPLSQLPAYAREADVPRARTENATAYRLAPYGINLPSGYNLTEELADRVCSIFRGILGR